MKEELRRGREAHTIGIAELKQLMESKMYVMDSKMAEQKEKESKMMVSMHYTT